MNKYVKIQEHQKRLNQYVMAPANQKWTKEEIAYMIVKTMVLVKGGFIMPKDQ